MEMEHEANDATPNAINAAANKAVNFFIKSSYDFIFFEEICRKTYLANSKYHSKRHQPNRYPKLFTKSQNCFLLCSRERLEQIRLFIKTKVFFLEFVACSQGQCQHRPGEPGILVIFCHRRMIYRLWYRQKSQFHLEKETSIIFPEIRLPSEPEISWYHHWSKTFVNCKSKPVAHIKIPEPK